MIRLHPFAALAFACAGTASAADAPKEPRPFVAMDNALGSVTSFEEKAKLLKELGYAGIGWRPGHTAEMLKALDAEGLKMFSLYVGIGSDPASKLDAGLAAEFELLKGRDTIIWVFLKKSKTSDDENAVRLVRETADLAAAYNLRVAIYPHVGCYAETVEGALRLVNLAERKNVGLSFLLCHFLKLDSEENLQKVLQAAAPHLMLAQTNGADSGETKKMGWDRLIRPLGEGTFDNAKLLAALDAIGYAGPVALQCYQIKAPAREHLSKSMAAWRKLCGQ